MKIIKNSKEKVDKVILEIMKTSNFRKELMIFLSVNISRKPSFPNYVAVLGNDYELCIKYSKGSLLQVLIAKTFNLTLFEVPRIAINTLQENMRLTDAELKTDKDFKQEVEILDNFSVHSQIQSNFKELSSLAFSEGVKYYLIENGKHDKNAKKLDAVSSLILSRMMPKIHEFATGEYKSLETDFNWNVILGQIT
jgi:hypothetical protein